MVTVPLKDAPSELRLLAPMRPEYREILTLEALAFITDLSRAFRDPVEHLLERRRARQARYDAGERPAFRDDTSHLRERGWQVAPVPHDLRDRRVEVTGPVDQTTVVSGLRSGASVFTADFEDSTSPTWDNLLQGQLSLVEAVDDRTHGPGSRAAVVDPLGGHPATLMVRPRGWHLAEKHVLVDEAPVPAPLFDFGLFFFHNARALIRAGSGPYFSLPKLQSHLEARLWNNVFLHAQEALGIARGTIRATVVVETLPAAFEMEEILFELREHAAGLACGRWYYASSFAKALRADPTALLPDLDRVTGEQPFLRACSRLAIKTCHRRGAPAIGALSAYLPVSGDPEANRAALEQLRRDIRREVTDGHDGTRVAHPGLVGLAREIFDEQMEGANQINRQLDDLTITAEDLLQVPEGTRSEEGLRHGIRVAVQYLEGWLRGSGRVPIATLLEDADSCEAARTLAWQWLHHGARLDDGRVVSRELFQELVRSQLDQIRQEVGEVAFVSGRFGPAGEIFERLSTSRTLGAFLTLPASEYLLRPGLPRDRSLPE